MTALIQVNIDVQNVRNHFIVVKIIKNMIGKFIRYIVRI